MARRDRPGAARESAKPPTASALDREWMAAREAAAFLGIGVSTLYRWVGQRRVPHVVLAGTLRRSAVRFRRRDLLAWCEARQFEVLPTWDESLRRWR